eukprot:206948_1
MSETAVMLQNKLDEKLVTNDSINVRVDIDKVNQIITTIGDVCDGNGPLPPSVQVINITNTSATVIIEPNDEQKQCIEHKIEYVQIDTCTDVENLDDEKFNWISKNLQNNENSIQHQIQPLKKSQMYLIRIMSRNKNAWGTSSKCISFKTKDMSPIQVAKSQMIFDDSVLVADRLQIINKHKVKCLVSDYQGSWGGTVKVKLGLPIAARGNNQYNINRVSWKFTVFETISWPNTHYFIGVVSNRTIDFARTVHQGLKDPFGITAYNKRVHKGAGQQEQDANYSPEYDQNSTVKVEYLVQDSVLKFEYGNGVTYQMQLPTNEIEITHWYPAACLRDTNDTCEISDVVVE